jgi:hypothetical protein
VHGLDTADPCEQRPQCRITHLRHRLRVGDRLTVGAASLGFLAVPALAPGRSPSQAAAATVIVSSYAVSGGGNAATGSSSDVAGLGLLIPAVQKSTG